MERWKTALKKLLFPGWGWVMLAVLLGGISLALTFLVFEDRSPFAYLSYILSAYGLIVFAAAVVPLFSSAKQFIHDIPLAHRYLTDRYFKVRSSLLLSFVINVCYAGVKLVCSILYASFWDGALAIYNILLCAVRLYLIRRVPTEQQGPDVNRELLQYRITGGFLIALDAALGVIAVQIVQHGHSYHYPGTLIYMVALHAFYSLTLAVTNAVKYRKFNSPVLSAAKMVNLTTALVSIFTLETAMLSSFGGSYQYEKLMTASTAGGVWTIVFCVAVYMVIHSGKQLKRSTLTP